MTNINVHDEIEAEVEERLQFHGRQAMEIAELVNELITTARGDRLQAILSELALHPFGGFYLAVILERASLFRAPTGKQCIQLGMAQMLEIQVSEGFRLQERENVLRHRAEAVLA